MTSVVKLVKQGNYKATTRVCVCQQTDILLTEIYIKCAAELQSMIKQFSLRVGSDRVYELIFG